MFLLSIAARHRIKGNESFKCGEYEMAILEYTKSLSYTLTATAYNNRAVACKFFSFNVILIQIVLRTLFPWLSVVFAEKNRLEAENVRPSNSRLRQMLANWTDKCKSDATKMWCIDRLWPEKRCIPIVRENIANWSRQCDGQKGFNKHFN